VRELSGARAEAALRAVRVDAAVDAYVPATYVPMEAAKIDVHRRIALAASPDELRELLVELQDRFGPPPAAVENLMLIQEARLKLARFGADFLTFRGQRVTVGKLVLGPAELRAIRADHPAASYAAAARELSVKVVPERAMHDALALVDAILASRRAAA
jgi:transcription-repair coupling factor (superfamily II helicase)